MIGSEHMDSAVGLGRGGPASCASAWAALVGEAG